MKHISLFSGIGGFDLAAQWAGWTNIASCEINPFGRRVLSHYWPDAYHHDDIKTLTGEIIEHEAQKRYGPNWRADGVILSGGFPCQPYSLAGKRLGKEDERHLWPEMLRVIREVKPDWIVGENVFGLVNWSDGLVFHEVQADLETKGYEVQAFILPACATDAPHRRDRLWIIAKLIENTMRSGRIFGGIEQEGAENGQQRNAGAGNCNGICLSERATTNAKVSRTEQAANERQECIIKNGAKVRHRSYSDCKRNNWHDFPTQSPVCSRNDGIPAGLDGITFPKWRKESIKAAGNAVVPQLVFKIFQTINSFTHGTQSTKRPEQQHTGKTPDTESGNAAGK